jgi:hypothetical protein
VKKAGRSIFSGLLGTLLMVGAGWSAFAADGPGYRLLVLDGHTVKWGKPALGSGAAITYAVVTTAMNFPEARNCGSVVPLDGLLENSAINFLAFNRQLDAALDAWSAVANVVFRSADAASADILIGAEGTPFGRGFTNVSHGDVATVAGPASITRSVICLNPQQRWKIGFDGDLDVYDLRYTLEHEIGHAIGLDHPGVAGELMDFRYREKISVLQPGDISGAQALYGPKVGSTTVSATGHKPVGLAGGGAERGLGAQP